MNIVFFGTDRFAKEVLFFLLEKRVNIVAVVTRADQVKGRGQKMQGSPVKEGCQEKGFSGAIYQPVKASDKDFIGLIKNHHPDLFVVVSYGQILCQALLDVPKIGTINVHPSLLPKYRGPSPIQSAVLAGEEETGVTIMEMVLAMDAGGIIKSVSTKIPQEMTFGELEMHLANLAKNLLHEVIQQISVTKKIESIPQKESLATYTKKIHAENGVIHWDQSSKEIYDFVRGMNPRPGARFFVEYEGKPALMKVFSLKKASYQGEIGKVLFFDCEKGLVIGCKGGSVSLLEVQLEGKKRMSIKDFINGFFGKIKIT